jgi:hypothetical protein
MSKSVLGILENETEAREVVTELTGGGFNDTDIEVVRGADSFNAGTNATPVTTTVYERPQSGRFAQTIANFFNSLLGDTTDQNEDRANTVSTYGDDQSYYAEALERGRIVLMIRAQDQESADYACRVLNRYGGDNVSTDAKPEDRGVMTVPVRVPANAVNAPTNHEARTTEPPMTPSERTEGRISNRGVRVYDYVGAVEGPSDLRDPRPDTTPETRARTAKP